MLSDLDIAQQATLAPVEECASKLNLGVDDLEFYGPYKAKISQQTVARAQSNPTGKLVLVTAMNPTPAGEGKTTVAIGLAQALDHLDKKTVVALREPSLGPVFGRKGGATGGGYSQVLPMEDINLHFTGDLHAVTAAQDLLVSMLDNHLHHGNDLGIDSRTVTLKRAMDINDRALRNIKVGLGGTANGVPRETGFEITAASEVMACVALARDISDLKERLSRIRVAYTTSGRPVAAKDLDATGGMAALLKDAVKPNIVQTIEGTPALVHMGPFGNVSTGCNSIIATKLGMRLADYTVTEAGFGSDLGGQKFMDIICRAGNFMPDAIVLAATVRALKMHGGCAQQKLHITECDRVEQGLPNLLQHIDHVSQYGIPVVVAINRFTNDSDEELEIIRKACAEMGKPVAEATIWADGGKGGVELANEVLAVCDQPSEGKYLYNIDLPLREKIETICKRVYGADGANFSAKAAKKIDAVEAEGLGRMPVCIAKTQDSLSDKKTLLGRPKGFTVQIADVRAATGAGYLIAYAGSIMTMFGFSKSPAAVKIDLNDDGEIVGLF
ncbi:MAG: formate--tetrahydrofolate ligase [Candidatus Latescibacteria bacterium]|jgi:formate--tetrahydrofolate ligase|nr:formate--tetrahydrofolate ligase [Candidatus Latescibacterota bacterium]